MGKRNKKDYTNLKFLLVLGAAVLFVLTALLSDSLAPYDPNATDFANILKAPGGEHIAGTDQLGRDIFSRVLCGAKNSLKLTFLMTIIVTVIGTILGVLAGYNGGITDGVIMRLSDMLLAFPGTVFAIVLVGMWGPGLVNTVIALALQRWTKYARMSRAMTLDVKKQDYIIQARLCGTRPAGIVFRYIIPNIISPIVVLSAMEIGHTMLSIAALSFLGLASQPPTPEWGFMLNEGKNYMQTAPWLMVYPGAAILITVVIFNLLGDSLRDILDPKRAGTVK